MSIKPNILNDKFTNIKFLVTNKNKDTEKQITNNYYKRITFQQLFVKKYGRVHLDDEELQTYYLLWHRTLYSSLFNTEGKLYKNVRYKSLAIFFYCHPYATEESTEILQQCLFNQVSNKSRKIYLLNLLFQIALNPIYLKYKIKTNIYTFLKKNISLMLSINILIFASFNLLIVNKAKITDARIIINELDTDHPIYKNYISNYKL